MDFFEGFLIGRALSNRGPRRRASSGTALPLYGGAFMIGVGIVMAYWTDAPASSASYVVGFAGLFFLVLGYVLDRSIRGEERRQYDQHYTSQPQQRSSARGAIVASLLTALFIVAIVWFFATVR